jgi:hypothetical protein
MNDFSKAPTSLSEIRGQDDCTKWSPRELLIYYLRRIDSGEFLPDSIIVLHLKHENSAVLCGMKRSKCTVMDAVALCEIAKSDLISGT